MKTWLIILFILHCSSLIKAQDFPPAEQQLENQAETDQNDPENDDWLQQLEHFKKHPLNLNVADENELKQFIFLNAFQLENFFSYRKLLGKLISIYELQAIPGWDVLTIKKILPYIVVGNAETVKESFSKEFHSGSHELLFLISEILENASGFSKPASAASYPGGKEKIFLRYRYQFKSLLQYGVVAEKDPGERFFRGAQKEGFDFYSFHLFAKNIGKIKTLAIGDFTVNIGQGLIQWQGLAFKKSADVMAIKRQSAILKPYRSAGEFYFNRGAGISFEAGKIELTAFASFRKLSANVTINTTTGKRFITSFSTSGYHRGQAEVAEKNNEAQLSWGGNISYNKINFHFGLNAVAYHFNFPLQKRNEPYNYYSVNGKSWRNASIDYSYGRRNFHFFGEAAVDKNFNRAFVNGLLVGVAPSVDLALLQRSISKKYQAVYGNAFTENSYPNNEQGIYFGIALRPVPGITINAYADLYKFPWLKYLVDAPSFGKDFLFQLCYLPDKQNELYTRFKVEVKQANKQDNMTATNFLVPVPKKDWRVHWNCQLNRSVELRQRFEILWYDKTGSNASTGFLVFTDVIDKPPLKKFSASARLLYFETGDYNSRIYAYENDVLYGYSIPSFFEKGWRWYLNINYDAGKNISCWFRIAQTIYPGKTSIGSGADEIKGNKKTEVKLQLAWNL